MKNQKKKKKKKRALVCYNCGGKGHSARLCPTPPDHATQAVDKEGNKDDGSSGHVNSMVQATKTTTSWEWDGSPQNEASGSVSQLWWDSGAAENVLPAGVCSRVKLSATRDLKQALGFVERAESESATTIRGNSRFA